MANQPSYKDLFALRIAVHPSDIDAQEHVNNVVYVRWVQEVAIAHWLHVSTEEMRRKYSWVLLRHEIDYRQPAVLTDLITGYTWVGMHKGPRFERFVAIVNSEGTLLAESKTT